MKGESMSYSELINVCRELVTPLKPSMDDEVLALKRRVEAGFMAFEDDFFYKSRKVRCIRQIEDLGLLPLSFPVWDGRVDSINFARKKIDVYDHNVGYHGPKSTRFYTSSLGKFKRINRSTLLILTKIEGYRDDVPDFIVDRALEWKKPFSVMGVMFIAKDFLITNIQADPILVGILSMGDSVGAVLGIWGGDFKEIDNAVLADDANLRDNR